MSPPESTYSWFCLRSHPKSEHIAAAHLRLMDNVAVYLPRIRFQRATRRGPVWVTEALFPGYLFARFDWQTSLGQVQSATGCHGVVHFGDQWPVLAEEVIEEMRQATGDAGLINISPVFSHGDPVRITDGALRGLRAVISQVMPGRDRATVLMEILGQQTMIELKFRSMIKEEPPRHQVLRNLDSLA